MLYFENTRTKQRYEVIQNDTSRGCITLKGRFTKQFTEWYNVAYYEKWGVILIYSGVKIVPDVEGILIEEHE